MGGLSAEKESLHQGSIKEINYIGNIIYWMKSTQAGLNLVGIVRFITVNTV